MCGVPSKPDHGSKDGTRYFYPHKVRYSCFRGYQLVGAKDIQCQASGTWNLAVPTCQGAALCIICLVMV